MITCEVCGGDEYEKHAGFMYCRVCQTQSQEYHEQEYDYQDHAVNVVRQIKQTSKAKSKKSAFYDDGLWTTYQGYNYILYGMMNEIKKCGATGNFEEMVFKLWAAYLDECNIAFISRTAERIPKLGFTFKDRDARLLYEIDLSEHPKRKKKQKKSFSNTSFSSISTISKRSLALQKSRIMTAEYEDHLLMSSQSVCTLADETLESLGKSQESETTPKHTNESEELSESFKLLLNKKDYKLYRNSCQSRKRMLNARDKIKKDIRSPGKNKLLSIIHLALLMTGSQIQLSDLFRFIRESHLSYAKVTHFFPREIKFPKKDFSYVEVVSDTLMPTHLRQRKITSQLAYLLKVENIFTPDMNKLIERYCQDLNLPNRIAELSKIIVADFVPSATVPRSKAILPSYEAWAMASIIFVIKLLFGLNDRTEIFLSHLARKVNSVTKKNDLFVFEDWQRFIECRKTVLTNFHPPTQEQLGGKFSNSKNFLAMLMTESKDEYRKDRFIPYSKYFIDDNLLTGVKETLDGLLESQSIFFCEFQPSLTPQVSHTETILQYLSEEANEIEKESSVKPSKALPEEILKQSFRKCDIEFVFDPKSCLKLVEETSDLYTKFNIDDDLIEGTSNENQKFLFDCSSNFWVFKYPNIAKSRLTDFKEEILENTPENFQWLITECARMLEMNVRDLYHELLLLEKKVR